ncbi:hypothetical protein [Gloeobacter kilaueensis]|uniref:PEP-CTERM protein-sorting domain-containing protein n=1 Tax=Gloeobacter kilaueensis (strain ATCC BAA-2537 / CCAP 1431/1 / ULC 316 / JS1) TaxID=1183438 RepID=U5QPW7_GLOK1|nr:hypothetical protein [Gloeobacter kilaueensis]AGY59674.1 hypothetical protein GKIL_3428 [Gloeobacter kilaueensis JS1]
MLKYSLSLALTLFAAVALSAGSLSAAQLYTEQGGDSSRMISTAQLITDPSPGLTGTGPLTGIQGSLITPSGIDLYGFTVTSSTFTATVTSFPSTGSAELFLFDSSGLGVFWSNNGAGGQTSLSASNLTVGSIYYLAINNFRNTPFSSGGQIFDVTAGGSGGPTGPGGSAPLVDWTGNRGSTVTGPYSISLDGAAAIVPEPALLPGLLGLGLFGLGVAGYRKIKAGA